MSVQVDVFEGITLYVFFYCQNDNFQTIKLTMMKLGV